MAEYVWRKGPRAAVPDGQDPERAALIVLSQAKAKAMEIQQTAAEKAHREVEKAKAEARLIVTAARTRAEEYEARERRARKPPAQTPAESAGGADAPGGPSAEELIRAKADLRKAEEAIEWARAEAETILDKARSEGAVILQRAATRANTKRNEIIATAEKEAEKIIAAAHEHEKTVTASMEAEREKAVAAAVAAWEALDLEGATRDRNQALRDAAWIREQAENSGRVAGWAAGYADGGRIARLEAKTRSSGAGTRPAKSRATAEDKQESRKRSE